MNNFKILFLLFFGFSFFNAAFCMDNSGNIDRKKRNRDKFEGLGGEKLEDKDNKKNAKKRKLVGKNEISGSGLNIGIEKSSIESPKKLNNIKVNIPNVKQVDDLNTKKRTPLENLKILLNIKPYNFNSIVKLIDEIEIDFEGKIVIPDCVKKSSEKEIKILYKLLILFPGVSACEDQQKAYKNKTVLFDIVSLIDDYINLNFEKVKKNGYIRYGNKESFYKILNQNLKYFFDFVSKNLINLCEKRSTSLAQDTQKCDDCECTSIHKTLKILSYILDFGIDDLGTIKLLTNHVKFMTNLLLQTGSEIDKVNINLRKPIHYSCIGFDEGKKDRTNFGSFCYSITRLLIEEHGASVDEKDLYGRTPLFLAVLNGKKSSIEALVDNGADLSIADGSGLTPFMVAYNKFVEDGSANLLNFIGKKSVEKNGKTLLHLACKESYKDKDKEKNAVVLDLIKKGFGVNCVDKNGTMPLLLAYENNLEKAILELEKKGARLFPKGVCPEDMLKIICKNDCINLFSKIMQKDKKTLNILGLDSNFIDKHFNDINASINDNGQTYLHLACKYKCSKIALYLIEKGIDVNCVDKNWVTPLLLAYENNLKNVISRLEQKGAKLEFTNLSGVTNLQIVCKNDCKNLLLKIIKKDAKTLADLGLKVVDDAVVDDNLDTLWHIRSREISCISSEIRFIIENKVGYLDRNNAKQEKPIDIAYNKCLEFEKKCQQDLEKEEEDLNFGSNNFKLNNSFL